jgi:hypothetical protein
MAEAAATILASGEAIAARRRFRVLRKLLHQRRAVARQHSHVVARAVLHASSLQIKLNVAARAVGRCRVKLTVDCDDGLDGALQRLVHLCRALALQLPLAGLVHDVPAVRMRASVSR